MPAEQGLHAGHPVLPEVILRLVDKAELVSFETPPQRVLQKEPGRCLLSQFAGEEPEIAYAEFLGLVHGHVGFFEQRLRRPAVIGKDGDAEGGAEKDPVPRRIHGIVQQGEYFLRPGGNLLHGAGLGDEDVKVVAADPGRPVPAAEVAGQPRAHLLQHVVPCEMSEGIVDVLEAVDVQHQEGKAPSVPALPLQLTFQAGVEHGPARKAGKLVEVGAELDLRILEMNLRQVVEDGDVVGDVPVLIMDGGTAEPLGIDFAALPPVPDLPLPLSLVDQGLPEVFVELRRVPVRLEDPGIPSHRLFGAVPRDGGKGRVHHADDARGIGDYDSLHRAGKHGGNDLQGPPHFLGPLAAPEELTEPSGEIISLQGSRSSRFLHLPSLPSPPAIRDATASAAPGKAMEEAAFSMAARTDRSAKKRSTIRSTSPAVLARIPAPFSWR